MARQGFIHDKLDTKFLILYLLARAAGPVDFPTLTDLTMCDQGVDYFEYAEAVAELEQTGHLKKRDECYVITDKGRRDGEACESSLPYSVRRKCNSAIAKVNMALRRSAQVRSQVKDRPEGGCTVSLALDDDSGTLLALELFCGSAQQGQRLADSFRDHPEQTYYDILTTLLDSDGGKE